MPVLTVIAGPNGAGKTRFSSYFKSKGLISVTTLNIDEINKKVDETELSYDFLRIEEQKRKQVNQIFLNEAKQAIKEKRDFCFESNLSSLYQISPVQLFDETGYQLNLIYIFLDSINKSTERVNKRSQQEKGHFVSNKLIEQNFHGGLKLLNDSFSDWDRVYLMDNNSEIQSPTDLLEVLLVAEQGKIIFFNRKPAENLQKHLPNIMNEISTLK